MKREEYNWIDDPFDDKKNALAKGGGMPRAAKIAFLLGMAALALLVVAVFVLVFASFAEFAAS